MDGFLEAALQHSFLQHALLGGILASIGCGIIGSYVVVKRIGFMAGGISHTVLGGMGIAFSPASIPWPVRWRRPWPQPC